METNTINYHIKKIFEDSELEEDSVIRNFRSSEKVFWRKVLDIYATSIDYNPSAESSVAFFKQVQNKMHWAAHKHTAAEIIYQRADSDKQNMGLTSWSGKQIKKTDVEIAKNERSTFSCRKTLFREHRRAGQDWGAEKMNGTDV